MTLHEPFLRYRRWRYLKAAAALSLVTILLYALHDPVDGPSGGTWLGYTLGTLGAGLIAWLAWLGVRKRQYRSDTGTVRGWVSAHVYLGLALLIVATLHSGFQFGWNIHTLAYALMVLVIFSGVYGIVAYGRYPALITEEHAQSSPAAWRAEIDDLNEQAIKLGDALGPDVHRVVVRSAERNRVGGGWRELLFGPRRRDGDAGIAGLALKLTRLEEAFNPRQTQRTLIFMASQIVKGRDETESQKLRRLLDLLTRRDELVARVNRDLQMHARMQVWLFVHVPLTGALLAALLAHIVAVFWYW